MLVADRPSAGERLEREVGARLAALLHSALTGDQTLPAAMKIAISHNSGRPFADSTVRSRFIRGTRLRFRAM